jgi:pimeloyl-ACP methyl ester carboxylesterase
LKKLVAVLALSTVVLTASAIGGATESAASRHLIYVHGRIIQEQQSRRPKSTRFGYYEFDQILETFRSNGFDVSGEMRGRSATESGAADDLVAQVRRLLASGVPPDRVTVVGASMGAGITLLASARLQNKDLRFAVLAACLSESVRQLLAGEGKAPSGRILSIREASDESSEPCAPWKTSPRAPSLDAREIVLHTGLSHGFLYRPLPEWIDPTVRWAMAP